jgi:ornithine cyclodeaminase/alanine dehydrogenase-like protein (mu-crystallin family)
LCIEAVEHAFGAHARGEVPDPVMLGMHRGAGSFHVKAGFLAVEGRAYFAAKLNANFPGNSAKGLPTIRGAVILADVEDGTPLAIMDSMSITALRTAAATAVAAKHLARRDCDTVLICGCGGQARAQLEALLCVRTPRRIFAYDTDTKRSAAFARDASVEISIASDLTESARASDIIVTCTTAKRYFLTREMVRPGAFVAAVGADNEDKQEIEPRLMAEAKVVTDMTEQARKIGDLHHALDAGAMTMDAVHAQLGEVIAALKSGRESDAETIVFDSTGTGLQDVAAAIAAYRAASTQQAGTPWRII